MLQTLINIISVLFLIGITAVVINFKQRFIVENQEEGLGYGIIILAVLLAVLNIINQAF